MDHDARQRQLVDDLAALTGRGARGPEDILNGPPGLLALVSTPGGPWASAQAVLRLLHAATAALGHPRGSALRALYALDPIPSRGMVRLTKTDRRQAAAVYYNVEGDSFRKTYERHLIEALAIEIHRRISAGDNTTHHDPRGGTSAGAPPRPGPSTPPPPAGSFKPNRLITPNGNTNAHKPS